MTEASTRPQLDERIFSYMAATGIGYADKSRQVSGDYAPLGILFYSDLRAKVYDDCPADLREQIITDMLYYQDRCGETIQVSTSGQTITLGYALAASSKAP